MSAPLLLARVLVLVGLMLAAPAAARGAVVSVGDGFAPNVTVDAEGTAYIAWYGPEPNVTSLQYCRLPRDAGACSPKLTIAAPGTTLSRPFIIVDGSTVRVVNYRYGLTGEHFGEIWEFASTDGGRTFDAGHPVGFVPFDEAVPGPGGTLTVITNAYHEGGVVQSVPLGGGSAQDVFAVLSGTHVYNGSVALADPATPLAVLATGSSDAEVRRLAAPGLPINDAASWTAPVDIGYADYPRLAAGPTGVFLLSGNAAGALTVRRWDGATFGSGATVSSSGGAPHAHLAQDPAGRLHAVFIRGTADGQEVIHARSDDGRGWSASTVVTDPSAAFASLRVSAAADHRGFVVWEAARGARHEVRVAGIGEARPPTAFGPGGIAVAPSNRRCRSRRNFRIRLRHPRGSRIATAIVSVNGRAVATRRGRRVTAPVDLRGLPRGRYTVSITAALDDKRVIRGTRRYRTCAPRPR